ncbi:MAG: hypothetical protein ABFS23_11450 [Pseudomonadota bacterium]
MIQTTLRRSLATVAALSIFTLFATTGSALACKNPFGAKEANASELPLIAQNDTGQNESGKCGGEMSESGKCGDEMSGSGKPGEAMKCGEGKCGSNMSSGDKPAETMEAEEGKPGEGKPAGGTQCGSGKCGGN